MTKMFITNRTLSLKTMLVTLLLTSCATGPHPPQINSLGEVRILSNTSDLENLVVKKHGQAEKLCASRAIDVADTQTMGVTLSDADNDSLSEGSGQGTIALGGMSSSVLIVSELMYRVCELSMNSNLDATETIELYKSFLDAAVKISSQQSDDGIAGMQLPATTPSGNQVKPD